MAMYQHYYTSCSNGLSSGAGFQTKAMSLGISDEEIKALNSLIGYRIPPSLVEEPVVNHPIALRYEFLSPERCALICSQSNGTDENGRPGNFFAHSVITSPDDFALFPPIMYWKHPFWVCRDSTSQKQLPVESAFEEDPSLELDTLWPFLEKGQRRDWFVRLLSAFISFSQQKRPIIILDDIDNVALWILAVSVMLPRAYRKFITFATYHHDPYQVSFIITGTTSDSKFRFSADEYISHFILNAKDNRVSEMQDTVYSQFILNNLNPELYETVLLDFFQLCEEIIPLVQPEDMSRTLTRAAYFYQAVRQNENPIPISDHRARDGIRFFLEHIRNTRSPSESDLVDLRKTVDLLSHEVGQRPEIETVNDYGVGLRYLKKYDAKYTGRARDDMEFLLRLMPISKERVVESLLNTYSEIYQKEVLAQIINSTGYLSRLTRVPPDQLTMYQIIWKYLAPFFRDDAETRRDITSLLENTFAACEVLAQFDKSSDLPPQPADEILSMVLGSFRANMHLPLDIAARLGDRTCPHTFYWLYYKIVERLPISERRGYRAKTGRLAESALVYEVRRDIHKGGKTGFLTTLSEWMKNNEGGDNQKIQIIDNAINVVFSGPPSANDYSLAVKILAQPAFRPFLDGVSLDRLIQTAFSINDFRKLSQIEIEVIEAYFWKYPLTPQQRGISGGSLAMSTGKFFTESEFSIRDRLANLSPGDYEREAKKLIERFFLRKINISDHLKMVRSTYTPRYEKYFWIIYWNNVQALFLDATRIDEFVDLLSFWFEDALSTYSSETPYLAPTFFLDLPTFVEDMSEKKEYKNSFNSFHLHGKKKNWYPIVAAHFQMKKDRGFLGIIRNK